MIIDQDGEILVSRIGQLTFLFCLSLGLDIVTIWTLMDVLHIIDRSQHCQIPKNGQMNMKMMRDVSQ